MKPLLEMIGIDDYELSARYIPAFIIEILAILSFHKYFNVSPDKVKEINNIYPLSIYTPLLIVLFSFPVKAILRLIGEILELFLNSVLHPTVFYIKYFSKNKQLEISELNNRKLTEILEDKNSHYDLVIYLKFKTRKDKKLREKLKEYGFFRNMTAGLLLITSLDFFLSGEYYRIYLLLLLIFFAGMLANLYFSYPKQLWNSFLEISYEKKH